VPVIFAQLIIANLKSHEKSHINRDIDSKKDD
jgi:hypothetical protein